IERNTMPAAVRAAIAPASKAPFAAAPARTSALRGSFPPVGAIASGAGMSDSACGGVEITGEAPEREVTRCQRRARQIAFRATSRGCPKGYAGVIAPVANLQREK